MIRRFFAWLKRFFLPPQGAPLWVRVLPYVVLGVLTLLLLTGGAYAWEYTNSPEFCGTSCHTMPPEYTAYLTSPHARIDCVDCHIGEGFIATRITRKAGDIKHVTKTVFMDYEFPIRADDMRPARETCELCHFPDKFSDDSLREIQRFENDIYNTPQSIYLTLKTGGGTEREGLGKGIHWHIQNQVLYYPQDELEQEIPYVRVIGDDGQVAEYVDVESGFDPGDIEESELLEMDCITCHNRITHLVPYPEDTIDQLLARGLISTDIPEIRSKAIEVYSELHDDVRLGLNKIAGLEDYYATYYPEYYQENEAEIQDAILVLQETYEMNVFPEQNSNWTTHPNNIGHKDSPGCFRCHGGTHLDSEGKAVRLECNLCHSVPVVAGPADFVADIQISRGPEPESHLDENWISMHHLVYNETCQNCHTTEDPGGTSNVSFCSNPACHGTAWVFAGFDAPALREVIQSQLPPTPEPEPDLIEPGDEITFAGTVGPILTARCGSCHAQNGLAGLNLTTYAGIMRGSDNIPVIVPGDASNSELVIVQTSEPPHFGQLSPAELELIINWINAGAPE